MKEEILELDYKKMVEAIDKIIEGDEFVAEMELKLMPKSKPYKQSEAVGMISKLLSIYRISHTLHCKSCRDIKYAKLHILGGNKCTCCNGKTEKMVQLNEGIFCEECFPLALEQQKFNLKINNLIEKIKKQH